MEIAFDLVIEKTFSVATKMDLLQNDRKLDEFTTQFQKTYVEGRMISQKTVSDFVMKPLSRNCV